MRISIIVCSATEIEGHPGLFATVMSSFVAVSRSMLSYPTLRNWTCFTFFAFSSISLSMNVFPGNAMISDASFRAYLDSSSLDWYFFTLRSEGSI